MVPELQSAEANLRTCVISRGYLQPWILCIRFHKFRAASLDMSPEYFAHIPILLMNYNSLDHVDVNLQRLDQEPFPPPTLFPSMEEGWHPYRAEFPVERHKLRGSKDAKKQSRICTRVTPFRMQLSRLLP
jgi:hypothetical protein